jgi:hypothetical protein
MVSLFETKVVDDMKQFFEINDNGQNGLKREIQRWIHFDFETIEEMAAAAEFYQNKAKLGTEKAYLRPPDCDWWEDPNLRKLSLLRRLACGIDFIQVDDIGMNAAAGKHPWTAEGTRIATVQISFLDFILKSNSGSKGIQQMAVQTIVDRLVEMERIIQNVESGESKGRLCELQQTLVRILNRNGGTYMVPNTKQQMDMTRLRRKHLPEICAKYLQVDAKERRSVAPEVRERWKRIQKERENLTSAYNQRKEQRHKKGSRRKKTIRSVGKRYANMEHIVRVGGQTNCADL